MTDRQRERERERDQVKHPIQGEQKATANERTRETQVLARILARACEQSHTDLLLLSLISVSLIILLLLPLLLLRLFLPVAGICIRGCLMVKNALFYRRMRDVSAVLSVCVFVYMLAFVF